MHPKYYEVLAKATKSAEYAYNELQFKHTAKGRQLLKQALEELDKLED